MDYGGSDFSEAESEFDFDMSDVAGASHDDEVENFRDLKGDYDVYKKEDTEKKDPEEDDDLIMVWGGHLVHKSKMDEDVESLPSYAEYISPRAYKALKDTKIVWEENKKADESVLESVEDLNLISLSDGVWRVAMPLVLATTIHLASKLTARQLERIIGVAAICASAYVKVPQIRALERAETTEGVLRTIEYSQILSYTISIMYGIRHKQSVLTWGDELLVFAQNLYLVSLIWKYSKTKISEVGISIALYGAYAATCAYLVHTVPHMGHKFFVPMFEVAILNIGYLPQIIVNNKNEHSGCLSAMTQLISLYMHLAHVYTNMVETGNWIVGIGYLISAGLNTYLLLQVVAFAENSRSLIERERELTKMSERQAARIEAIANAVTITAEELMKNMSPML